MCILVRGVVQIPIYKLENAISEAKDIHLELHETAWG